MSVNRREFLGAADIQVNVGTSPENIVLRDPKVRKRYLELGKQHGVAFNSVAAGSILNKIPLKSEPQSAVYVIDAAEAAAGQLRDWFRPVVCTGEQRS